MTRAKPLPILLLALLVAAILGGAAWLLAGSGGGAEPESPRKTGPDWPVSFEVPSGREPDFERVLLVTIDTLRADHVSGYGYRRATTPFLDSLIERGVAFDRAVASVSHTAPSHATMLTGLAPTEHGVVVNGLALPGETQDLSRLFGAAGFETAAFLNVKFLSAITKNFHRTEHIVLKSERITGHAVDWVLRRRRSDRFFVWLHLYDPHHWKHLDRTPQAELEAIYAADSMDRDGLYAYYEELHALKPQAPGEPFDLGWTVEIKNSHTLPTRSRDDYLDFVDAYDAQIRYSDNQLKRLYTAVESLGLPGRTLWVITSDHGEGLASHEVAGHGGRIYQEQLLVPLVFHASDGSLQKKRVDELVQHIDLYPTFAEILGARVEGFERPMAGASLWPLITDGAGWRERPAFSQRRPMQDIDPDAEAISSLQTSTHKYILHEPGEDEFFDLAQDPKELVNLAGEASELRDRLKAQLEERLRQVRGMSRGPTEAVPEEFAQELNDLGYGGEEH